MKVELLPLAVLMATLLSAQAVSKAQTTSAVPPLPFEDIAACPFEGCVYREWTATQPVVVRSTRQLRAPITFRVKRGEKVTALTGVVVTISAGRVRFRKPQDLSSSGGPFHIGAGQMLYLLTYQGEGFTKAWFNGRVYEDVDTSVFVNGACYRDPNRCAAKVLEPSKTEWWVQVRNQSGRVGWTKETDKFDGKDRLG